jgi:hypothetical protein
MLSATLAIALATACMERPKSTTDRAMRILTHQLASDIKIEFDKEGQIVKEGPDASFVCGVAVLNQPGLLYNMRERYIVRVNPDDSGIVTFDGSEARRAAFDREWRERCA